MAVEYELSLYYVKTMRYVNYLNVHIMIEIKE